MHTGTVLITGSNRGIGLELARQYAADGWRVIACCRTPAKAPELKRLDGKVEVHPLDVTSRESIDALAKALKGTPVDVLVNNAGLHGDRTPFGATDPELWKRILAVNVIAPVQVTAALLDNVSASAQRKVIAITSKVGSIGDGPTGGSYAYRTSKTALNMAMANAAHELKAHGVTIVLIHPGWVQTDMGGPSAPVAIDQSVAGIRRVIDKVTQAETGHFYDYTGRQLPW
jgi:NAD(P)-dependent dehydrogenase (short-subunit alcohol dehydrogenase family)